jgi:hypothetical protein
MANNPNLHLYGYPQPFGTKIKDVFDHTGPGSYLNIGTSGHAGDVINASDLSAGGFDLVHPAFGGYSNSGNYIVKIVTGHSTTTPTLSLGGLVAPSVTLQWFTTSAAFGAISTEVTDTTSLALESVRLDATMV